MIFDIIIYESNYKICTQNCLKTITFGNGFLPVGNGYRRLLKSINKKKFIYKMYKLIK